MAFDAADNPGIGMMLYRSELGSGTFSATDVQLRWNYSVQGVIPGSVVKADVFGIEMVLVPGGPFWVGDEESVGTFRQATRNFPFFVSSDGSVLRVGENGCCDQIEIKNDGIWVDGDGGISKSSAMEADMNPDYPTGFRGFYCMKYEITQGQYRDFLNTLTRVQQNARTTSDISGTRVSSRYVMSGGRIEEWRNGLRCDATLPLTGPIEIYCDLDGDGIKNESNDGEWLACNFLTWPDGAAYMDWSGLRHMTELEYEKACRGPNIPVPGEYAWGTAEITSNYYSVSDEGTNQEGIATGYSLTEGNAHYAFLLFGGPCRVGIFAANSLNTGRVSSGAGYYGAMELTGNLWEHMVTIGNSSGRQYLAVHGDGKISEAGDSDVADWPPSLFNFTGLRGGSFYDNPFDIRVSDRIIGAAFYFNRQNNIGFRGSRSVHPSGAGY
jgi:formylglycine-generating enzyme required for sulfatase activity